jgi:hypothetical protein
VRIVLSNHTALRGTQAVDSEAAVVSGCPADRRHEKYVEELAAQLGFKESITVSGAVMTLPAAVADLIDWVGDRRKYLTVQFGDWLQVVDDYQESLRATGPKLKSFVESLTAPIELLLQSLIEYETESIDPIARADLAGHLALLKAALTTPEATVEAWRDLVRSAENDGRSFEEVMHRRDILWAIVYRRNLDLGHFGVLRQARDVLIDDRTSQRQAEVHRDPFNDWAKMLQRKVPSKADFGGRRVKHEVVLIVICSSPLSF